MSHNALGVIEEDVFWVRKLLNLQKIYLRHCKIRLVSGHCFEHLTNLVDLDLSFNVLQEVPSLALSDCRYLMSLSLRGNPIKKARGLLHHCAADVLSKDKFNRPPKTFATELFPINRTLTIVRCGGKFFLYT